MIGVNIVTVGKLKQEFVQLSDEYSKRLSKFCKLKIVELPESKLPSNPSDKDIAKCLEQEGEQITKHMQGHIVVLDSHGIRLTSEALAKHIKNIEQTSSQITFVIGSSYGLEEKVKAKADLMLSFSDFTFPHQLMRIILLEQVYRSMCINNNILYHK